MLPTFVIGLREGLEAALIVGIIAAFLGQQGRRDALAKVWAGVFAGVLICIGVGIGLRVLEDTLDQVSQERLETVIGLLAVAMVTYMIVWMTRHARGMKRELEGAASDALARGSAGALIVMAFLAVLREGFETVVFLLAVTTSSHSGGLGLVGAILGILVSALVGYGIYRGGVRLNLSRFFKATGAVLVVVAAGLLMSALHTAWEGHWLSVGQQQALDLSGVVRVGSPLESLFTGVLGIQARPTVIEVASWVVYVAVLLPVVLWSGARKPAAASPTAVEMGARQS